MTIKIPQPTLDEMIRRAEADYPRESCGVLVGQLADSGATAEYFLPCNNTARHQQTRRFLIDPLVYQGGSDALLGPRDAIEVEREDWGIDFEAERRLSESGYAGVVAAVELLLEGLHLSKRLNKDSVGGRASYRARA